MNQKQTNIEKGTEYELFINNSLNNLEGNISWLWSKIPELELRKAEILGDWNEYRFNRKMLKNYIEKENGLMDTGCDILLKKNDKFYLIQCKNYAEKNYVTIEHLAGFFMMTKLYNLDGIVYYTSKLSPNLNCQKKCNEIKFIKNTFENIENIEIEIKNKNLIKNIEIKNKKLIKNIKINNKNLNENIEINNKNLIENIETKSENLIENKYSNIISNAYDYQIEAYNKLKEVFSKNKRAILQLPCGLGKTLISMKVGLDYDTVIIISPLKQYCIQNLSRFKSEYAFKDYESLIIDSDGTRDINEILKFIKKNKKIILSVCFKSCDILFEILNKVKNAILIIDEFHNINKNDLILNESGMHKILFSDSKIMFMSATPRIFYFDDNDEEYDFYEEIFGKIAYKCNMGDAIKDKKICDYEIYVPDIKLDNQILINHIDQEINIKNLDNDIVKKCNYFLRGILETGCRKSIIYVRTHVEAEDFKKTFIQLNEYFALELNVDTILSSDNKNNREDKLKLFTEFNGFSLLINVFILNECIDKKECDSVFITYPSESKISNIQRICRANRIDENNIHKISKIFLWCDEYQNDLSDILSHVKEFDNTFSMDKVKILSIHNTGDIILERNKNSEKYIILDNFIVNLKIAYSWMEKFDMLQKYIQKNKNVPSIGKETDNNLELKRLSAWFQVQKMNFRKKIKLMKYDKYYNLWKQFIEKNPQQFLDNEKKWIHKMTQLKKFIDTYQKTPSKYSKENKKEDKSDEDSEDDSLNEELEESSLGSWLDTQKGNSKKEIKMFRYEIIDGIKKYEHPIIIQLWNEFNNEYSKYMLQGKEQWYSRLDELRIFLDANKDKKQKTPSSHSKDSNIKSLASFIATQKKNYENRTQIMKESDIYNTWTNFLEEFKDSLMTENEIWLKTLNDLDIFIENNKKRPNKNSNNSVEKKLGEWITKQLGNLKDNKGVMNKYSDLKNNFRLLLEKYNNIL